MGKMEKLKFFSIPDYIVPNPNANPELAMKKTPEPASGSCLQFQLFRRLGQEGDLSPGVQSQPGKERERSTLQRERERDLPSRDRQRERVLKYGEFPQYLKIFKKKTKTKLEGKRR